MWVQGIEPRTLEEQSVLLVKEPSLQPPTLKNKTNQPTTTNNNKNNNIRPKV